MSKLQDLTGLRYGHLIVQALAPKAAGGKTRWACLCDCGKVVIVQRSNLLTGHTKSCGCRGRNMGAHNMSKHPAYKVWAKMKKRCNNKNDTDYHYYGGRGISVCTRWDSFNNFWKDMGATWQKGLTLDRIDNDGNYEPSNCHWVSPSKNSNNRRNTVRVDTPWGYIDLKTAAEKSGIPYTTLMSRVQHKWPAEKLFQPVKHKNK